MHVLKCVVISMLHLFYESNALHMEFYGFSLKCTCVTHRNKLHCASNQNS